jgi:peptidoglycan/LPS O-acetylase OafA/YrhL
MDWLERQFELSRGLEGKNLRAMEGLRGFAVALVFLVHFVSVTKTMVHHTAGTSSLSQTVHAIGNAGVDLFFVLSGYLIYGALINKPSPYLAFLRRRVLRIYPVFLVTLAIYLLLSWLSPQTSKLPKEWGDALLYIMENLLLLPGMTDIKPVITVAWSLSYEMFYYLLVPVVVAALQLRTWQPSQRIYFFLALNVACLVGFGLFGGHIRLVMFIAGILLYDLLKMERGPGPSTVLSLLLLLLGFTFKAMEASLTGALGTEICLQIAFFALCWACFASPNSGIGLRFSWTPLRWLGNMSYSYYLLHGLALVLMAKVLTPLLPAQGLSPWSLLPLLPFAFGVTLLPSAAMFILVERPLSLKSAGRTRTDTGAIAMNPSGA